MNGTVFKPAEKILFKAGRPVTANCTRRGRALSGTLSLSTCTAIEKNISSLPGVSFHEALLLKNRSIGAEVVKRGKAS